jgi:hypothetical protein
MLNHPVFALFHRRLSQETRSGVGHLLRLVWLGLTLLAIFATSQDAGRMAAPGLIVHSGLLVVNFVLVCLLGTGIFAKAIAEEKEDRTLGLLRMTSLGSVSILLGKAGGALLCLILLMLAQLPFALLSVTLGGISWTQVVASYAALLGLLLVQASLGLFWSVQCQSSRGAALMTVLSLALLFLTPWFFFILSWGQNSGVTQIFIQQGLLIFQAISPFYRAYTTVQGFDGEILSIQVISNVAMAVFFFLLAWWRFAAGAWEQPQGSSRIRQCLDAIGRCCARRRRSWRFAMMWQTFHFVGGGRMAFATRYVGILLYLCYLLWLVLHPPQNYFYDSVERRLGDFMLSTSLIALSIEAAWSLGRLFGIDRQEGCWASLYASPLSLGQIVRQKVIGWLLALSPWILLFAVGFVLSDELSSFLQRDWHDDVFWAGMGVVTAAVLLIVYLSLFARRAPVMMTAGILLVGNISLLITLDIIGINAEEFFCIFANFGASVWLVFAIRRRLIQLATE